MIYALASDCRDSGVRPMLSNTAHKTVYLSETQNISREAGRFVTRRIWLPKILYDAVPYFYITAGFAAFFATLYITDWFWVLPHYLLFSVACLHLGFLVYRRRKQKQPSATNDT